MARILLVEDEPSLQLALGDTLADEGYSPVVAGTVSAALAELDAAAFDLVLCDLRLPDGDGMTVLAQARRRTVHRDSRRNPARLRGSGPPRHAETVRWTPRQSRRGPRHLPQEPLGEAEGTRGCD